MGDMELQLFADRLKELRLEKGLTQAQFVEGLGITTSALSAYEKNLKNPSISVAKRIAEKYNVSIDWLCGLSAKKTLSGTFSTYGDIVTTLFEIDNCTEIVLIKEKESEFHPLTGVFFDEPIINSFLEEWLDASNILHNTSINKAITQTMYNSWKKSKLEELQGKKLKKSRQK